MKNVWVEINTIWPNYRADFWIDCDATEESDFFERSEHSTSADNLLGKVYVTRDTVRKFKVETIIPKGHD